MLLRETTTIERGALSTAKITAGGAIISEDIEMSEDLRQVHQTPIIMSPGRNEETLSIRVIKEETTVVTVHHPSEIGAMPRSGKGGTSHQGALDGGIQITRTRIVAANTEIITTGVEVEAAMCTLTDPILSNQEATRSIEEEALGVEGTGTMVEAAIGLPGTGQVESGKGTGIEIGTGTETGIGTGARESETGKGKEGTKIMDLE